ncbi:hypothetical protein GOV09_00120 [Candidatus Woesearchaeota archaeon]|nr:hypothetical protein [Candidatus Woesearchaeota archaeon]
MAKKDNPFVAIPAALGGIIFVTVVVFIVFAVDSLMIAVPIVWALVALGAVALFFAYFADRKKE